MATASASTLVSATNLAASSGIGDEHVVGELALEAVAVFRLAHAALQRAEHAEFALDRHADQMRHVHDLLGHAGIVFVVARGLGVFLQRTIHHHRGEAVLDGGEARRGVVAMVLMQAERDVRIDDLQRLHHLGQHEVIRIGARAAARLDDHRRIRLLCRLHDGEALLHIVDVEGRHAIAVFGGVVQKLPESDACQGYVSLLSGGPDLRQRDDTWEFAAFEPLQESAACR